MEDERPEINNKFDGDLMRTLANVKPAPITKKEKKEQDKEKVQESEDLMNALFNNLNFENEEPKNENKPQNNSGIHNLLANAEKYAQENSYAGLGAITYNEPKQRMPENFNAMSYNSLNSGYKPLSMIKYS